MATKRKQLDQTTGQIQLNAAEQEIGEKFFKM
jgi:hypothetical protein